MYGYTNKGTIVSDVFDEKNLPLYAATSVAIGSQDGVFHEFKAIIPAGEAGAVGIRATHSISTDEGEPSYNIYSVFFPRAEGRKLDEQQIALEMAGVTQTLVPARFTPDNMGAPEYQLDPHVQILQDNRMLPQRGGWVLDCEDYTGPSPDDPQGKTIHILRKLSEAKLPGSDEPFLPKGPLNTALALAVYLTPVALTTHDVPNQAKVLARLTDPKTFRGPATEAGGPRVPGRNPVLSGLEEPGVTG